jgi:hypothetical protein
MSTNIVDLPFTPPAPKAATPLPERDIPRETLQHAVDPQATPSYIPPKAPDYIAPAPVAVAPRYDYVSMIDEMKLPVILAVLFFVFNLTAIQDFLARVIPSIRSSAHADFIKSAFFGLSYYGLNRAMEHVNNTR